MKATLDPETGDITIFKSSAVGMTEHVSPIKTVVAAMRPPLKVRRGELALGSTSRPALRAVIEPPAIPKCHALRYRGPDGVEVIRVAFVR